MIEKLKRLLFVKLRIWKYNWLSTNKNSSRKPIKHQPVLINGKGTISFGKNVQIGVINSPYFYTTYAYIEARNPAASIHFGNNISINNSFSAVANTSKITIEDDVLIGFNCAIIDSDFHETNPKKRENNDSVSKPVVIKKNVFIGNNVSILKGVTIGENSIIANGSVVSKPIPNNVIAAGIPAKVLKTI